MDIKEFRGEYRWLSNFWPCKINFEGLVFNSVEAAYVASKTKDIEIRKQVQKLSSPADCKRFGRKIKLRSDWNIVKLEMMEGFLRQKFYKGSVLAIKLKNTGHCKIEEGNKWNDTFWGICNGIGENNLGKLIMKIRKEL